MVFLHSLLLLLLPLSSFCWSAAAQSLPVHHTGPILSFYLNKNHISLSLKMFLNLNWHFTCWTNIACFDNTGFVCPCSLKEENLTIKLICVVDGYLGDIFLWRNGYILTMCVLVFSIFLMLVKSQLVQANLRLQPVFSHLFIRKQLNPTYMDAASNVSVPDDN